MLAIIKPRRVDVAVEPPRWSHSGAPRPQIRIRRDSPLSVKVSPSRTLLTLASRTRASSAVVTEQLSRSKAAAMDARRESAGRTGCRGRGVQDGSVMGLDGASLDVSSRQFPRLTFGKLRLGDGVREKPPFAAAAASDLGGVAASARPASARSVLAERVEVAFYRPGALDYGMIVPDSVTGPSVICLADALMDAC